MGAYSPAPIVTPATARARDARNHPADHARHGKEGIRYTGFLYAGLMIDAQGNPKTLEFNCRMGDPETQPIMARLKSDFVEGDRACRQRHARHGRAGMGPPHGARRGAGRARLSGQRRARATSSTAFRPRRRNRVTFHAGTTLADGKLHDHRAAACCAWSAWATRQDGAEAGLRNGRPDPLRRHAVSAATSAGARLNRKHEHDRQQR